MSSKEQVIPLADGERIVIADQDELGVSVIRQDRPKGKRWRTLEETLIPLEAIPEVARRLGAWGWER
jgi:hypothetical protein